MSLLSPQLLAALAVFLLVFRLAGRFREPLYLLFNLCVLASLLRSPQEGIALAAFLALGYGLVLLRFRAPRRRLIVPGSIVLLLAVFLLLKRYSVVAWLIPEQSLLAHSLRIIGLSYILFRLLSLVVDGVPEASGGPPGAVRYLNFLIGFPTLLAGPIQRYEDFSQQLETTFGKGMDRASVLTALQRLSTGLVKKFVVANLLALHLLPSLQSLREGSFQHAWLFLYVFTFYVYLDFSGYSDIAIGLGLLLGFRFPENFDAPLLSDNVGALWNRWHMSFSSWLRDYVFTPVSLALAQRSGGHLIVATIAGYTATMVLCGLWHDTSASFLAFGLMHAGGLILWKLYESALRKRLGRQTWLRYSNHPVTRSAGMLLTFHFFVLSMGFVALPFPFALSLIRKGLLLS